MNRFVASYSIVEVRMSRRLVRWARVSSTVIRRESAFGALRYGYNCLVSYFASYLTSNCDPCMVDLIKVD